MLSMVCAIDEDALSHQRGLNSQENCSAYIVFHCVIIRPSYHSQPNICISLQDESVERANAVFRLVFTQPLRLGYSRPQAVKKNVNFVTHDA